MPTSTDQQRKSISHFLNQNKVPEYFSEPPSLAPSLSEIHRSASTTPEHISGSISSASRYKNDVLAAALEALPMAAFVIDNNRKIVSWNADAVSLSQISAERVIGLRYDIFAGEHIQEKEVFLDLVNNMLQSEQICECSIKLSNVNVMMKGRRFRTEGLSGNTSRYIITMDKTSELPNHAPFAANEAFEPGANVYYDILNLSQFHACVIDQSGQVVYQNQAHKKWIREDLVGKPLAQSTFYAALTTSPRLYSCLQGLTYRQQHRAYHVNPDWSGTCVATGFPLYGRDGIIVGAASMGYDTTEVFAIHNHTTIQSPFDDRLSLEILCEHMSQLLWLTDESGRVVFFSPKWEQYTGVPRAVLLADETFTAIPIHPDDREMVIETFLRCIGYKETFNCLYRLFHVRTNEYRWVKVYATWFSGIQGNANARWIGTTTDVHDSENAKRSALASREQLSQVVNSLQNTLIISVDENGVIEVVEGNLENANLLLKIDDAIGRKYSDVIIDSRIKEHIGKAMQSQQQLCDTHIMHGRYIDARFIPLTINERNGIVGLLQDVTETHSVQEELRQAFLEKAKLQASEHAAKEASKMKSEFLANMSHEIRTPIAGVIGMSDLLIETKLTEDQREFAENVKRCGECLLNVINDILDFSKVEAGRLELESVPFNILTVIEDVDRIITFAANKKNIKLERRGTLSSCRVIGDSGRLAQILVNLLSNAVKFTSKGSVILTVNETLLNNDQVQILIIVQDSGIGISEEAIARLFTPFSQADTSTTRRFGGSGLGLCICKQLVDLMRGTIEMRSQVGLGTTVTVQCTLPLAQSLTESPVSPFAPDLHSWKKPIKPKDEVKILIAEDNVLNQQIAVRSLKKMGFQCVAVGNGSEALKAVTSTDYDLVLMDCQMPVMDGYQCTSYIRQHAHKNIKKIPIIAMTASAIIGDREKCLSAGMDDYLSKPVRGPALEAMIMKWLRYTAATETSIPFNGISSSPHLLLGGKHRHSPSLLDLRSEDGLPDSVESRLKRSLSLECDTPQILETALS